MGDQQATISCAFDDLLAARPELKTRRTLTADVVRRLLEREKGQCTWCGVQVPKGRSKWCSDGCVRQYQLRCVPGAQSNAVYERDNWVCQLCGLDIRAAQQTYQAHREAKARELYGNDPSMRWYNHHSRYCPRWQKWLVEFGYGRGRFSEVDHVVPVSEGGGLCSLDNLRLICGQCHAQETKELAGRLARKRKGQT